MAQDEVCQICIFKDIKFVYFDLAYQKKKKMLQNLLHTVRSRTGCINLLLETSSEPAARLQHADQVTCATLLPFRRVTAEWCMVGYMRIRINEAKSRTLRVTALSDC